VAIGALKAMPAHSEKMPIQEIFIAKWYSVWLKLGKSCDALLTEAEITQCRGKLQ